jgi:hypothetical protein
MATFHWRVSRARVERDGPFSVFPGVDRTIAILDGSIALAVDGAVHELGAAPFAFAGDAATSARLPAGPITDLNVMTRRGRATQHVRRLAVAQPVELAASPHGTAIAIVADGELAVDDDAPLARHDAVIVEAGDRAMITGRGVIYVVELEVIR